MATTIPYGYGTPMYYAQQQAKNDAEQLQREQEARAQQLAQLSNNNAQQAVYNRNALSSAQQAYQGTNYSLTNDQLAQALRALQMRGDLAQNTMLNNRYLSDLQLNVAQTARNQRDRATEMQQNLYQQGARQIDSPQQRFRRLYGYP